MTLDNLVPKIIIGGDSSWKRRLNALLRFAKVDPWKLTNGDWQTLLDDLYFALHSAKRDPEDSTFNRAATREGVRDAYYGLKKQLEEDDGQQSATLHLAEQDLEIHYSNEIGFWYGFTSRDFPTMIYMTLAHLLHASDLRKSDIIRCSHCESYFVPLRKPREDTPNYCSRKCANVVAARNFRASKKKKVKKAKIKPK